MAASKSPLPALWAADRRAFLLRAVLCGAMLAASAGLGAWGSYKAVATGSPWWVAPIALAALGTGLITAYGRVVAERLGQSYVQELRTSLMRSALGGAATTSPGVLIARATNDLTAVRTWISLGVAPLVTAVPLVLGALGFLTLIDPLLSLAFGSLVGATAGGLAVLGPRLFMRARTVRRRRGRLARAVADVVVSQAVVRSAGGEDRETRRIGRLGERVAQACVERARVIGAVRGIVAAVGGLATAAVVGSSLGGRLDPAATTAALLVVGLTVAPLGDLGRALEYRQNHLAARMILIRALTGEARSSLTRVETGNVLFDRSFSVRGVVLEDGVALADVDAAPGDRLVLDCSPDTARAAVSALCGADSVRAGSAVLSGSSLRSAMGVARGADPLPPGSLERVVRYRVPRSTAAEVGQVLESVGLGAVVDALPRGTKTTLQPWGAPLTASQRILVAVARAVLGSPALLILDGVRGELDAAAAGALDRLVAQYPGVVLTTDRGYGGPWRSWTTRTDIAARKIVRYRTEKSAYAGAIALTHRKAGTGRRTCTRPSSP